ncbi:MAG: hypothetical protein HYU64_13505 [Armatimonadetes bacterium]|nr:hypothetical protein [Armatimonadota bacterium]
MSTGKKRAQLGFSPDAVAPSPAAERFHRLRLSPLGQLEGSFTAALGGDPRPNEGPKVDPQVVAHDLGKAVVWKQFLAVRGIVRQKISVGFMIKLQLRSMARAVRWHQQCLLYLDRKTLAAGSGDSKGDILIGMGQVLGSAAGLAHHMNGLKESIRWMNELDGDIIRTASQIGVEDFTHAYRGMLGARDILQMDGLKKFHRGSAGARVSVNSALDQELAVGKGQHFLAGMGIQLGVKYLHTSMNSIKRGLGVLRQTGDLPRQDEGQFKEKLADLSLAENGYKDFLAQEPKVKWAEEGRDRFGIESHKTDGIERQTAELGDVVSGVDG